MDFLYKLRFLRPELFMADMVRKYAQGKFSENGENSIFFEKAKVLAVDKDGGKLENEKGEGKVESISKTDGKMTFNAKVGPKNPKYSIKGRLITSRSDMFSSDDEIRVYWPLFPDIAQDIVPDEYVYVFWEDKNRNHGIWVNKCPAPFDPTAKTNRRLDDKNYENKEKETKADLFPGTAGKKEPTSPVDNSAQNSIFGTTPDQSSKSKLTYTKE